MNSGSLLPDDTGGRDVAVRAAAPAIVSVSLLVATARRVVEREIGLLWVAGEISGFRRAASGHCYFDLKDASAQVSCVFFRHKAQHAGFPLRDGIAVELRATASIYEARGSFQLNVESIRLAGLGALYEQFARLKARLEASGWFAPERKRPLPAFPRAVGIVTSTSGAAVHDVLTALARRWPALPVIVYPCSVQGAGAAAEIAAAIATANARREVDVLIVGRGGGSIEDLWAFNEETVARAVLDSALPVVSAVGHETDFTICDFVADARAATPTAAAALVAPDRAAIAQRLDALARTPVARRREVRRGPDAARRPARAPPRPPGGAARPPGRPDAGRRATARAGVRPSPRRARRPAGPRGAAPGRAAARAAAGVAASRPHAGALVARRPVDGRRAPSRRLAAAGQALAHLNPQSVLDRGYAIVTRADGGIVRDASTLAVADEVGLRLARGTARARVTDTDSGSGSPA